VRQGGVEIGMEDKTKKIQIKSLDGEILYEYEAEGNTIKKTLEEAVRQGVNLREANLWKADLRGACLGETDLLGANLWGVNLPEADLREADLREADLWEANLRGADIQEANLQKADLQKANLRGANLREADLRGANLREADLRGANLREANINGTDLKIYRSDMNILRYQKGKLRAFKYLTTSMDSPYQACTYEVGGEYEEEDIDTDERNECGKGLNVATLEWCLRDTGMNITDNVYVEVEFDAEDIVAIPYLSDGKFRVRKLKVLRIIPKKELKAILK